MDWWQVQLRLGMNGIHTEVCLQTEGSFGIIWHGRRPVTDMPRSETMGFSPWSGSFIANNFHSHPIENT